MGKMFDKEYFAVLKATIQVFSLVITSVGIGIEIAFHADIGYLLITAGGVLMGISEKIKILSKCE